MPTKPLSPCTVPGCPGLSSSGRCAQHKAARQDRRESASKRGYGKRWQRWRAWFVARHPLCEDCREQGKIVPTAEVHHIKKVAERPELQYIDSNCRALCKRCHSARTGRGE